MALESKAETIRRYIELNPDLQPAGLADLILAEIPEFYSKRSTLRVEISKQRGSRRTPAMRFVDADRPITDENPLGLPVAFDLDYEPYAVPPGIDSMLVMSDIHLPFHDIMAVTAAIQYGIRRKVDAILLNGDILDIYHGSRFAKDPKMPPIKAEVDACRTLFGVLRKHFKDALIIFKEGNHDERFMANLLGKSPEYAQIEGFTLYDVMRCHNYGVEYVEDKRIVKAGKLPIYHGHEFPGGGAGGVNPARALFNKIYTNGMVAHSHRTSEHAAKRGDGKLVTCWSLGCLSQLHPDFARNNQWNHGFAVIDIAGEEFEVENRRIFNGQIF